jgi:hypothetical protein
MWLNLAKCELLKKIPNSINKSMETLLQIQIDQLFLIFFEHRNNFWIKNVFKKGQSEVHIFEILIKFGYVCLILHENLTYLSPSTIMMINNN